MANKTSSSSGPLERTRLTMPVRRFRERLDAAVERGNQIMRQAREATDMPAVEEGQAAMQAWSDYNVELLKQAFTTDEIVRQYVDKVRTFGFGGRSSYAEEKSLFVRNVQQRLDALQSIENRIDLWADNAPPEEGGLTSPRTAELGPSSAVPSRRVFVVHGHDADAKETVARYLEKLGLDPIILHEQPNHGRTLIEKFEVFSDVQFAVVLLTPDDVGRASDANDQEAKPRPRQNVVLELGYFLGALGRRNVCTLVKQPIELPTDYEGVVYLPIDDAGGWKLLLAKEIKGVIAVDLNAAVS